MKKIILVVFMLLLFTSAFAKKVKITNGKDDYKDIVSSRGDICVVFDWSEAYYDEDIPLTEYWGDSSESKLERIENSFIKAFNSETRAKLSKDATDAKYKMTVRIENVDKFFAVMAFPIMRFKGKIWGTIEIEDMAKGRTLVEIEIKKSKKGSGSFVPSNCIPDGIEWLGG